ncbi:MAG: phenylalanine--tRNA ligase subunit beta [Clostridiaceae bacterium]|nr:phenylalanine--tRNA ligase subunit beta [Clostridiaceae bacterium]
MKVSLNWIKEYVSLPEALSTEQLSYDLTMRTVEVEGTANPADTLSGCVLGLITRISAHPQADMLKVCTVDVGRETPSTIVCGGSNIYEGMRCAVALPGAKVRWHGEGEPVLIKATKLRGIKSEGMICAAAELELDELFPAEDEHEVIDLADFEGQPGDALAQVLELSDIILEIDNKSLTNRPDLWGHYGIARELAAIYGLELKPLPPFERPEELPEYPVTIENPQRCRRYVGIIYEGVASVPSPWWLQTALWKTGVRPINALVDLTNYVMLAVGQPTHGFDKENVREEIIIRNAKPGETLTLLDGHQLELSGEDLMICDATEPIALGGIMGGAKDSILPTTSTMILEIANFEPIKLRRSANRYQVRTESANRNEKGLDTQRIDQAMAVANNLIKELFPGARMSAFSDVYPVKTVCPVIPVKLNWLNIRLGRKLTSDKVARLLRPLGFEVISEGGALRVSVPSWRATGDVNLPDDVLEEVARIIGYDSFDFIPPTVKLTAAVRQPGAQMERRLREYFAARCDMQEVFTYPWVDKRYLEAAGIDPEGCLSLSAPPSPDTASLRSSLIPAMLAVAALNLRYFESFRVFEMAQVFAPGESHPSDENETLPLQKRQLAAAFVGQDAGLLFREMKGVLEDLPRAVMSESLGFAQQEKPAWADPKAWLNILSGDEAIGSFGVISLRTSRLTGIKRATVVVMALDVDALVPLPSRSNVYQRLPLFPVVEQDFSILVDEKTAWQDICTALEKSVDSIVFIEEYRGKQIPQGKKSVMFRVHFGSDRGTLTAEQIDEKMNSIIKKINKLGGEVRN